MKWMCLMTLCLVSCGSDPISQPFLAQPWTAKKGKTSQHQAPKTSKKKKKTFAGKVTMHGLAPHQLADLRIIPEEGGKLRAAENGSYQQVDGLWWRGASKNEWLKIPDFSEAWIGKGPVPQRFTSTAHRPGLQVHTRTSGFIKLIGVQKNGVNGPAWVRNTGLTQSPVPSPWGGGR